MRNPRLLAILADRAPVVSVDATWSRPLRLHAHVGVADLPDELITSIRVVVRVADDVVVCTNVNGVSHAWPGGRREPDETYAETACREVREETGWLLDPASLELLGFLHVENLGKPLPPYPHPDVVQLVYVGRATARAADEWTDTEGFEISSTLVPLADACHRLADDEPLCIPFLEEIRARAA